MTFRSLLRHEAILALILAVALAVLAIDNERFFTAANLLNQGRLMTEVGLIAVVMTFVIITGGIDLSVGSQVALINAVAAVVMAMGYPWPLVVVAMIVLGGGLGFVQGWFIAYQGIPAFIVTLAGLSILRGFALYLTQGYSIPIQDAPGFFALGRGVIGGVPVPAIIAAVVAVLGYVAITSTKYGRQVVAVGSNAEAARRVGMPAKWIIASVYLISGVACAVAGLLIAARLGSGSSNAAVGFELQVIAAVVLGGTSLMGGRGTILGTVLGTLTIAVIGNGLILMHISPFFTQIVTGAIILIAIWLNTRIFTANFRFGSGKKR